MPTFFSPGGRTFAGGDMMPCVIPWPQAGGLRAHAANTAVAISLEMLDLPGTAHCHFPFHYFGAGGLV